MDIEFHHTDHEVASDCQRIKHTHRHKDQKPEILLEMCVCFYVLIRLINAAVSMFLNQYQL